MGILRAHTGAIGSIGFVKKHTHAVIHMCCLVKTTYKPFIYLLISSESYWQNLTFTKENILRKHKQPMIRTHKMYTVIYGKHDYAHTHCLALGASLGVQLVSVRSPPDGSHKLVRRQTCLCSQGPRIPAGSEKLCMSTSGLLQQRERHSRNYCWLPFSWNWPVLPQLTNSRVGHPVWFFNNWDSQVKRSKKMGVGSRDNQIKWWQLG